MVWNSKNIKYIFNNTKLAPLGAQDNDKAANQTLPDSIYVHEHYFLQVVLFDLLDLIQLKSSPLEEEVDELGNLTLNLVISNGWKVYHDGLKIIASPPKKGE